LARDNDWTTIATCVSLRQSVATEPLGIRKRARRSRSDPLIDVVFAPRANDTESVPKPWKARCAMDCLFVVAVRCFCPKCSKRMQRTVVLVLSIPVVI
jgi:hypothetical protein